eukprot:gene12082-12222_t
MSRRLPAVGGSGASSSSRAAVTSSRQAAQQRYWTVSKQSRIFSSNSTPMRSAAPFVVPKTRQAWHITQQGDLSSLRLLEEPMPTWQQQQPVGSDCQQEQQQTCLVEVRCLGLNLADVFCCLGLYKAAPKGDFIPGLEFSGVVLATFSRADVGDRVLGVLRFGAFASHVSIPATYLRPVPDSWSYQQAASYPVQTLTAAFGLFECGGLKEGQTVLVHSAAGGVGLQALQILNKLHCNVLGLVGNDNKVALLNSMHDITGPVDTLRGMKTLSMPPRNDEDSWSSAQQQHRQAAAGQGVVRFEARTSGQHQISNQLASFLQFAGTSGFDIILDSLAADYFQPCYNALNPCGRHVVFGAGALTPRPGLKLTLNPFSLLAAPASLLGVLKLVWSWLQRPRLDVLSMPGDNKGVVGFNLIWLYDKLDVLAALYQQVDGLQLDAPMVGKEFAFEELPAALAYLQSGQSVGKVVCSRNK